MKKQFIILFTLLSVGLLVNAQEEYRVAKSSGLLKLNITGVIVEGYDGKDIIFSGQKTKVDELDERAKGLVSISSSKFTDNTGMGISVTENGQEVNVNLVSKKPIGILTIKVPQNVKVSILNNSNQNFFSYSVSGANSFSSTPNSGKNDEEIVLKNLKSEIEVSVYWNKIRLENNTGPMNIKTVTGSVDAIFNSDIKGPVSIISATNYVDVTLPASTKANIEMGTDYGKLYAGKEFKIDLDKEDIESVKFRTNPNRVATRLLGTTITQGDDASSSASGVQVKGTGTSSKSASSANKESNVTTEITGVQINGDAVTTNQVVSARSYSMNYLWSGGDKIKGKLNGGGIDLIFKSTNKNVYLRQQ